MNTAVAVILPIFGLIGLGFLSRRSGYLDEATSSGLSTYVFGVAVPALIFRTLAEAPAADASPWAFWAAYFGGVGAAWMTGSLVVGRLLGQGWRSGVSAGITAGFANTVLLGVPLIFTTVGEKGAVPVSLLVSVHTPVMLLAGTLLMEWSPGGTPRAPLAVMTATLRSLASNPLIIAIAAGALWHLTGLPLPDVLRALVGLVAGSAVPCALFALGMDLVRYGMLGAKRATLAVVAAKLVIHPLVVFLLATYVFEMPPVWTTVAVIFACSPTGVNAYIFAGRYGEGVGLASSGIGVSTALAAVTVGLWLALLGV